MSVVAAAILLIGWVDYLTGTRLSLELFYLVPVMLSVSWLGPRAGCITAVACIVSRVTGDLANGPYSYPVIVFWNRLTDLSMYFVVVWVLHGLITLFRDLDRRVTERTSALQKALSARDELQSQLFEISRRERSAIGHDLHDGLGQHLTATALATRLLVDHLAARADPGAGDARAIEKLIQDGIGQTRRIARGLLLSAIEPDQLSAELKELASKLGVESRVACHYTRHGEIHGLNVAAASHFFYIAQEAGRNALRHARPSRIEFELRCEPREIALIITDNGTGLPSPSARNGGMGLRIMAHRADLIGGTLEISAGPAGTGTAIHCRMPLPKII